MSEYSYMPINNVCIEGRLTHDPSYKVSKNGDEFVSFQIAQNEKIKGHETTSYFRVVGWAKNVVAWCKDNNLQKGNPVHLYGKLRSSFIKNENGSNTIYFSIVASRIFLITYRQKPKAQNYMPQSPPQAMPPQAMAVQARAMQAVPSQQAQYYVAEEPLPF